MGRSVFLVFQINIFELKKEIIENEKKVTKKEKGESEIK
jgi:hypothetical protein